jgi:hypothetical protein
MAPYFLWFNDIFRNDENNIRSTQLKMIERIAGQNHDFPPQRASMFFPKRDVFVLDI